MISSLQQQMPGFTLEARSFQESRCKVLVESSATQPSDFCIFSLLELCLRNDISVVFVGALHSFAHY
jgi:hypothetical protein